MDNSCTFLLVTLWYMSQAKHVSCTRDHVHSCKPYLHLMRLDLLVHSGTRALIPSCTGTLINLPVYHTCKPPHTQCPEALLGGQRVGAGLINRMFAVWTRWHLKRLRKGGVWGQQEGGLVQENCSGPANQSAGHLLSTWPCASPCVWGEKGACKTQPQVRISAPPHLKTWIGHCKWGNTRSECGCLLGCGPPCLVHEVG